MLSTQSRIHTVKPWLDPVTSRHAQEYGVDFNTIRNAAIDNAKK
jgi:hypothetical protein